MQKILSFSKELFIWFLASPTEGILSLIERKYYDALMGTLDIQFKEIKSMGEAICRLENRIEDGFSVGTLIQENMLSITSNRN